jgi:DNA helicase-2/ATP-dependent DNA helicase PcrA
MTLHAAKGLEFPVVFIAGLEQGMLPIERGGVTADIEEERRLMYVGITRAKQELFLSRTSCRMQYGKTMRNPPSMFLDEIPADCLMIKGKSGGGDGGPARREVAMMSGAELKQRQQGKQWSAANQFDSRPGDPFAVGERVVHSAFGRGVVLGCTGPDQDRKIVITFDQGGQRELMLAFCVGKLARES